MITAEGIEGAAYVGDYQPVNLYAGAHKVAGWHSQTVSGEGTVSLDGAYNIPPDALVVDGKCEQTVGVWGTNLITNGDFSNGTTGWSASAAGTSSYSVLEGMAHFLPTVAYEGINSNKIQTIAGHKYYVSAVMQTTDAGACVYFIGLNASSPRNVVTFSAINDGLAHSLSAVVTCIINNVDGYLKPQSTATSGYSDIAVDNVLCIDLTAAFGAGNEPTAEQMDAYLAAYPNSWFDGSALITTDGTPNSPSPTYPAPITTITGDLSIAGANGDLSDTSTIPLGAVELCSLPDGTKDEYDAVTGVLTKRCGKYVGDSGTSWTISDAADNASFISDRIQAGTLSGKVLTAPSTCAPTVYYALATPYEIQLAPDLPVVRTGIKNLTVSANITPHITATVKAMD